MHRSTGVNQNWIAEVGLLVAILGLTGCAARSAPNGGNAPDSAASAGDDLRNAEVTILIRNHHWLDLNIYLIRGSVSEQLGTAGGLSERVISLPWRRVAGGGTIRLGADPIGQSRGVTTETIVVRPSSVVEWTIESGLRGSHVSVY
jgi:hypothetical protein